MNEVEEIKQRLDVAEVVGSYIPLKQAGRNLKAACPFHNEKTASFMVSPEKGIWHCFGCGEGGDVIKFVMRIEGLEFREALEKLAAKAGIELKQRGVKKDSKERNRLLKANAWAVKYYQATLSRNPRAIEYLKASRGLTDETIERFKIGYAPDAWEGLSRFLIKKGFSEQELMTAGLASKKRGLFDIFRGRIMLPIADREGRVVGFTGRLLADSDGPKYLNTPQTAIYDKSRVVYGLDLARESIRQADEVVVVEGNMDVIASHQAGTRQTVAVSGTALTLDQLKILSRLTRNVKFAFDQDAAGLAAASKAIDLGQQLGLTLKVIMIEGAKDPDELIKRDPKLWVEAIREARYIVDYIFERYEREYDLTTAVGKRQFSDRLARQLKRIADPVERGHYIQRLAERTGVPAEDVRKKVDQAESNLQLEREGLKSPIPAESRKRDGRTVIEESLLEICLAHPRTRVALADIEAEDFQDDDCRAIYRALKESGKETGEIARDLPNQSDYIKILTLRGEETYGSLAPADRSFEAFQLVRRLQILARQRTKSQISKQLREAESSGDTLLVHSLLEKYQALIGEEANL
jgi:DNA primase